jgi:hypothetical protein
MWHYVDRVWTDVSEERIAFIFLRNVGSHDQHGAISQKTAFFKIVFYYEF